jgi:hypothetical protein
LKHRESRNRPFYWEIWPLEIWIGQKHTRRPIQSCSGRCLSGHLAKGVSPWRYIQSTRSSVYAVPTPNPKLHARIFFFLQNKHQRNAISEGFCVCTETRCGQVLWLGTKEDGSPNNLHSSGPHAAVRTPLNGACC